MIKNKLKERRMYMSELPRTTVGNLLFPTDTSEFKQTIEEVRLLDPELFTQVRTSTLVEMGAQFDAKVTHDFGTPDAPKWNIGTVEERLMAYHNGGEDGHTSVGVIGIGVPRAVLLIASAVNSAGNREVYDPMARGKGFYAASAHDTVQNCGRALLDEGQGEGRGDERLSAELAHDWYREIGGDPTDAQDIYDGVMATAFNPNTKTQNINYDAWKANPNDSGLFQSILGQELTAAADLLSLAHIRGPVGSVENIVEVLCSNQSGRMLQEALQARGRETTGVADMGVLLDIIGADTDLHSKFTDLMDGQAKFFAGFKYSDEAIRAACNSGIDELFPVRSNNVVVLTSYTQDLHKGSSPRDVWQHARSRAGYVAN